RSADVDLLHQVIEVRFGIRGGADERIEVDRHDVHQPEAVRLEGRQIVGPVAPRQDSAVQGRVQRLDPAVHHLGEARQRGDARDGQAGAGEDTRGAPGGDQFEAAGGEAATQIDDTGLVGYAKQGSW